MGRLAMRGQRGVVPIHLVEPEAGRVVAILDDVEPETTRLVHRVRSVVQGHFQEFRDVFRFHAKGYVQDNHGKRPSVLLPLPRIYKARGIFRDKTQSWALPL